MPKSNLKKLTNSQVDNLKGKLLEVRRIGARPIFIEVGKTTTIKQAIKNADIPTDDQEIKVEAQRDRSNQWEEVALSNKAINYSKIAVTTKVAGAH